MDQTVKEEEVTPEEVLVEEEVSQGDNINIMAVIAELPNAPSKDQIDYWKQQNDVQVSLLSETDIFIWRPINWHEYKTLQKAAAENHENPTFFDEQLVVKCLLWPKLMPEHIPGLKGGTIPTLSQQIMGGSNFVPPQIAMELVIKL